MAAKTVDQKGQESKMKITPLGAGQEVGRSCVVIEFKGKKIMVDCGIHPAFRGIDALPYFDSIEPETIDLVLISHFHLDHIASLPHFTERTAFKGRVFMTHATKAIGLLLIKDYVRVSHLSDDDMLYNEQELIKCFDKVETIDFHQDIEVDGVKFSCHHAGHVLGGAMFNIEIAGVRILYTGDYSREEDRHLPVAELPPVPPHVMICESTYGVRSHEPLHEREARFTKLVQQIVTRGGRCLIPIFASGRAQELLLIIEEFWEAHPELQGVPVYYVSALANKCMSVYQTYINMMNNRIRKQFAKGNPFIFKHIRNPTSTSQIDDIGPCVMMASPGMLQSGMSRELFEAWCPDERNGVIIPGYCVEGTLAMTILSNPKEIMSMDGKKLPLRMSVDYISFSAHVDYTQNSSFIKEVSPMNLVLVHGAAFEMDKLRKALEADYRANEKNMPIYTPGNTTTVTLDFKGETSAKIIGSLAAEPLINGQLISGVVVTKDFETGITAPDDLGDFHLTTSVLTMKLVVPYYGTSVSLLEYHLRQMFQLVEPVESKEHAKPGLRVFNTVNIFPFEENSMVLEWVGNAMNDMIADSVLSIIVGVEKVPSSIKALQEMHEASEHQTTKSEASGTTKGIKIKDEDMKLEGEEPEAMEVDSTKTETKVEGAQMDLDQIISKAENMLRKHFEGVTLSEDGRYFVVWVNDTSASINIHSKEVQCDDADLKKRAAALYDRIHSALYPVALHS